LVAQASSLGKRAGKMLAPPKPKTIAEYISLNLYVPKLSLGVKSRPQRQLGNEKKIITEKANNNLIRSGTAKD
jgi:hypothetical protein